MEAQKIMAALVKAQGELENPVKDKTADAGKFKYQFCSLPEILDLIRPILAKHELGVIHLLDTSEEGITVLHCRLIHSSGEYLESTIAMPKDMTAPQEVGSWLSYMRRYSLNGILGIAAEDDDDAEAAQRAAEDEAAIRRQAAREKLAEVAGKAKTKPKPENKPAAKVGKRFSAHDGRELKPGENPLPPDQVPDELKIDARLGSLCMKDGITPLQVKEYAVTKGHIPPETDMSKLPDSFVNAYIANWDKIVKACQN